MPTKTDQEVPQRPEGISDYAWKKQLKRLGLAQNKWVPGPEPQYAGQFGSFHGEAPRGRIRPRI
jgi:hypothetical protein